MCYGWAMDWQIALIIIGVAYLAYAAVRAFFPKRIKRGTHAGMAVNVFSPGEGIWLGLSALILGGIALALLL